MATTTGYVDPRVKRTRKLLQQAFMELFREKDFAAISIQDITELATVNRATFYAHFPDKYALVDSMMREQFQQFVSNLLPAAPMWEIENLRLLIRATFDFLRELHHDCKPSNAQFDPLVERALQEELNDILLSWLKQANTRGTEPRVRIEMLALVMSWAIFGTAVTWSKNARTPSAEEMSDQVLSVLMDGAVNF